MLPSIKKGAVFISDAHYSPKNKNLEKFVEALISGKLVASQIFWMGDIFDLLVGEVAISLEKNKKMIDKINSLSLQQYYFEGNHDFNLQEIFPQIAVIPRKQQPMIFDLEGRKVAVAHGDIFTPMLYDAYISTISNKWVLKILNIMNMNHWITKKIEKYNSSKKLCKKIDNFKQIVDMRVKEYKKLGVEMVIEGHFHQNLLQKIDKEEILYLNLPAFVCSQSFFIVKSNHVPVLVEQHLRSDDGQR